MLSLKLVVFTWFINKYDQNKSIKTIYIFWARELVHNLENKEIEVPENLKTDY